MPIVNRRWSIVSPRLIPVVKAEAYGHGAVAVARALARAGADILAVAIVEEGAALRETGIPGDILVLEGAWPGQEAEVIRHRLIPAVHSPDGVRRLELAAQKGGVLLPVHLKLDTGMARLGAPWDRPEPVLEALEEAPHLSLAATFSHLSSAEEEDPLFTGEQILRFDEAVSRMRKRGMEPGELHLANSAGLLYHKETRTMSARAGIALYGYPPAPQRSPVTLLPVMRVKARIGRIHTIHPGTPVGYNRRFIADRTTRAAAVPIGYADGYRRALTGSGRVIIRDRLASVLGVVSMDMIVVDVTDLPEAAEGDDVILLGSSPSCRMDAADWADLAGTIPYEILCGIAPRVPRIYLDDSEPS